MANLEANRVDREDKELKGLQDKGMVNFDCSDCGKRLLVLQLTAVEDKPSIDVEVLTRVAVKCCGCDGFSYVQQIAGRFHPGAPSDDMAFDVFDGEDGAPTADVLFKAWSK